MAGDVSRRNGAKSRGPRTAAGKARASRNAVSHGLSVLLAAGIGDDAAVAGRTALLLHGVPGPVPAHLHDLAREAARADLLVDRVRGVADRVRREATAAQQGRIAVLHLTAPGRSGPVDPQTILEEAARHAPTVALAAPALARFARYEAAARARRRRAFAALDAALDAARNDALDRAVDAAPARVQKETS
ncbi:hypothetical protein [Alsobacter sp. R-9]